MAIDNLKNVLFSKNGRPISDPYFYHGYMIDESVPVSESVIFIANIAIGYRNIDYFAYRCTSSRLPINSTRAI